MSTPTRQLLGSLCALIVLAVVIVGCDDGTPLLLPRS